MRLDDLVVIGLLLSVVLLDVARGAPGASPAIVLSAVATVAWLSIGRRRPADAPATSPPNPAVLVRARNDARTVRGVVKGARAHGLPVLVVDDGSTDDTVAIAEAAGADVLRHPRRRGPGEALTSGMRLAAHLGHTHVICLAGDGSDDPADVALLLAAIRGEPTAVFVAEGARAAGRRLHDRLVWLETGWRLDDRGGPRAWPLAPVLGLHRLGPSAALETELLTRALWAGVPVRTLACRSSAAPPRNRPTARAARALTHALLLTERVFWPPRWFVRMRTARRGRSAWTRRLVSARARLIRFFVPPWRGPAAEGLEHLARAFDEATGAVLLTAPVGDPNRIPRPAGAYKPLHVLTIAGDGPPRPTLATPPEPPDRGRRPLHATAEEGYLALSALRALREGEVLLVEGDRLVDERVVPVQLLGRQWLLPAGPWLLAALARVPVIVVVAVREGGADRILAFPPIRCHFDDARPHDAQIQEWAQRYADHVDAIARRWPEQSRLFERTEPDTQEVVREHGGGVAGGAEPPLPQE